jgi:hypothetical protein
MLSLSASVGSGLNRIYHERTADLRVNQPDTCRNTTCPIENLVATYPQLDWGRIQYWVQQFAEVLEMPELWTDIARFQPKAKPRK